MDSVYQVSPLSSQAQMSFVALIAALLILLLVILRKPMPQLAKVGAASLLGVICLSFGWTLLKANQSSISVDQQSLILDLPFYGRSIPLEEIELSKIRKLSLAEETNFSPELRLNALGLPGYQLGWYKLQDSGRALLSISDETNLVIIPLKSNYSVIISLKQSELFVQKMGQE